MTRSFTKWPSWCVPLQTWDWTCSFCTLTLADTIPHKKKLNYLRYSKTKQMIDNAIQRSMVSHTLFPPSSPCNQPWLLCVSEFSRLVELIFATKVGKEFFQQGLMDMEAGALVRRAIFATAGKAGWYPSFNHLIPEMGLDWLVLVVLHFDRTAACRFIMATV